jgi:hypothetical protein
MNDRTMETFISGPLVDVQNDFIPTDSFVPQLPWFAKHGLYTWYHTDFPIGEPIGWRVRDGRPEIKVGIYSTKDSGIQWHDDAWRVIKRYGKKGSSSIRGLLKDRDRVCIENRCFSKVNEVALWAVGWVGEIPANKDATVNFVSAAKTGEAEYWLRTGLHSEDSEIRDLTEQVVLAGYAKSMNGVGVRMEKEPEIVVTDKMKAALKKGKTFAEIIANCPKCRDYVAKMESAGVPTELALDALKLKLAEQILGKAYESFEECVADNQDKANPEGFCAWLKREVPGACKDDSQAASHSETVDKGVSNMPDNEAGKQSATPPNQGEAANNAPAAEDYMALIKGLQAEIAELKAAKAVTGDFAKLGEEMKKSMAESSAKIDQLSERILAIEGKIGVPAAAKRGQAAGDGAEHEIDFSKATPTDLIKALNKRVR